MAPKNRGTIKVPPPPDFIVPKSMGEQDLPPDWLQRSLLDYYAPEIKQARQISAQIEDAYRKGDFEAAEQLDAQLEVFYEKLENQLADHFDDADPERDSGGLSEDEDPRMGGMGTPSAVEQIRDTYGRYLRGDFADKTIGDPDLTPEQALAARIRSSLAGEGFTPTGDDLNLTGDQYNPRGYSEASRAVQGASDEQIIAMAKDLFDAHQQTKARVQQNQGTTRDVVQMLARLGAPVAAITPIMAASRAQAGQPPQVMDERQLLRSLATNDPRLPQFAFLGSGQLPGYMTAGTNSGPNQVDPTWRDSRAIVLPTGQPADAGTGVFDSLMSWSPKAEESQFPENLVGWDMSMDVTPKDRWEWYTSPQYLGEEHRKYISDAASMLDEPLIPRTPARRAGWAGPDGEGDITPRQFLDSLPSIAYTQADAAMAADPKNPEAQARMQRATEQYLLHLAGAGKPFSETPDGQAVWAALTGQVYDRKAHPHAADYATSMIDAIGSGRTNRRFENDPSISQSEFSKLQQQYGDEANKMLTPGGVSNARREAAYDFFGAMQGTSQYAPHLDNASAALMAIAAGTSQDMNSPATVAVEATPQMKRMQDMMMPGLAGRMKIASQKLDNAKSQFANAGQDKPFVTSASLLNRTDPMSFQGLYNLAGNSSWAYGRNIQNPYEPVLGELLTRSQLPKRNLEFFQDLNDRTFREAPIRPDSYTPEQFRETRAFTIDRRNSYGDYFDTFKPLIADFYNKVTLQDGANPSMNPFPRMNRTYPTGLGSIGLQLVPSVGRSAAQSAMIGIPVAGEIGAAAIGGKSAAAAAGSAGKNLLFQLPQEILEEGVEEVAQDPQGAPGLFKTKTYNSWMQPDPPGTWLYDGQGGARQRTREEYQRMLDPQNRDEWNMGVEETKRRRLQQARDQYEQWDRSVPRQEGVQEKAARMGFGPMLLN